MSSCRPITNRLTRVSLGALVATALMCVASVSIASAQGPAPPMLPFIPDEDFNAPALSGDAAAPTSGDAPAPTSTTPAAPEEPAPPAGFISPPSTTAAPKLMGSRVGWSRRTLSVKVSCGASGTVSVLRNGRGIGRRNFACPASGAVRVRVRITAAAARRLRVGTPVRVKVRTGAQRDTKRMRVVRAVRRPSDAAVSGKLAHASSNRQCSAWYVTNIFAMRWPTSGSWYESYCADNGFYGTHIALWWDYYYWTVGGYWSYYGTWTNYTQDGAWVFWDPASGSHYGPYY
jgi:hypothetical protein